MTRKQNIIFCESGCSEIWTFLSEGAYKPRISAVQNQGDGFKYSPTGTLLLNFSPLHFLST